MTPGMAAPASRPSAPAKRSAVLKRVSFGSSKGSMVETLIYEHSDDRRPLTMENGGPAKVRVTFYESQKPRLVTTPESPLGSDQPLLCSPPMESNHYPRQMSSTDSGVDNPFRPDGELSREAETIVSLIREGKPITETDGQASAIEEEPLVNSSSSPKPLQASPPAANGSAPKNETVEVQHGIVVPPSDASQVEHVVIKKKPKCKCCVVQ